MLLSGASALVFETLWLRQAALAVGNSVWASAVVLASFMAGLAAGNLLATRLARRVRLLRVYAVIEASIAVLGVAVVVGIPLLVPHLGSLVSALAERPALVSTLRVATAFLLLALPATAMGATLPVLVGATRREGEAFARTLGRLYGWNTLGAVLGALAGELVLIEALGVRGSALAAAGLNLVAAAGVLWIDGGRAPAVRSEPDAVAGASAPTRLLAAAFLSGGTLLALEVVWFRLLLLDVHGTSHAFAVMLAVVLLGISVGGFLAGRLLGPRAAALGPGLAALCGIATVVAYVAGGRVVAPFGLLLDDPRTVASLAARLMLGTSIASGALFTALGAALRAGLPAGHDLRATSALTAANTLGAMAGSLAGGFLLLPRLGAEVSLFLLAAVYLAVAVLAKDPARRSLRALVPVAALLAALALFPWGTMESRYLARAAGRWLRPGATVVAVRQGLAETAIYVRETFLGAPVRYRLVTNAISMSGSGAPEMRYMKHFVYWPVALRPDARRALLISYGVGQTARALTDTRGLEHIDVVDISPDILELGRIPFAGGGFPLDDPRVEVHVEDGRFHLLSTRSTYDIVTAEPPPPKFAGIGALYSREFFSLLRERLAPGGIATYWLPVYQLDPGEARAVIKAFCLAFEECSLWSGYGAEWVLVGHDASLRAPSEEAFTRQWRDPVVAPELAALAYDVPELLGTGFIGDSAWLRELTRDDAPLDDDHPHRLRPGRAREPVGAYERLAATPERALRFAASDYVRRLWPASLRARTLEWFGVEDALQKQAWASLGIDRRDLAAVEQVLRAPARTPVLWTLNSTVARVEAAARWAASHPGDPVARYHLAVAALADRRYAEAEALLAPVQSRLEDPELIAQLRVLAAAVGGDLEQASRLRAASQGLVSPRRAAWWAWLDERFRFRAPS